MKIFLIISCILFSFTFSISAQKNSFPVKKVQSDVYQVYQAVLTKLFINPQTKQVVIHSFTSKRSSPNSEAIERNRQISLVQENLSFMEVVDNYAMVNQKPSEIKDEFKLAVPIVLLNDKQVTETINKIIEQNPKDQVPDKIREFLEQIYQGSYAIRFSNIGFNKEKTQALLHVEYSCGGLRSCGMGEYILLIKESKEWIIKKEAITWIS